jgi:hypothetical protein
MESRIGLMSGRRKRINHALPIWRPEPKCETIKPEKKCSSHYEIVKRKKRVQASILTVCFEMLLIDVRHMQHERRFLGKSTMF